MYLGEEGDFQSIAKTLAAVKAAQKAPTPAAAAVILQAAAPPPPPPQAPVFVPVAAIAKVVEQARATGTVPAQAAIVQAQMQAPALSIREQLAVIGDSGDMGAIGQRNAIMGKTGYKIPPLLQAIEPIAETTFLLDKLVYAYNLPAQEAWNKLLADVPDLRPYANSQFSAPSSSRSTPENVAMLRAQIGELVKAGLKLGNQARKDEGQTAVIAERLAQYGIGDLRQIKAIVIPKSITGIESTVFIDTKTGQIIPREFGSSTHGEGATRFILREDGGRVFPTTQWFDTSQKNDILGALSIIAFATAAYFAPQISALLTGEPLPPIGTAPAAGASPGALEIAAQLPTPPLTAGAATVASAGASAIPAAVTSAIPAAVTTAAAPGILETAAGWLTGAGAGKVATAALTTGATALVGSAVQKAVSDSPAKKPTAQYTAPQQGGSLISYDDIFGPGSYYADEYQQAGTGADAQAIAAEKAARTNQYMTWGIIAAASIGAILILKNRRKRNAPKRK